MIDDACPPVHLTSEGFVKHTGGVRRTSFELLQALRRCGQRVEVAPWIDRCTWPSAGADPSVLRRALLQASDVSMAIKRAGRAPGITHGLYYDPSTLVAKGPTVV